MSNSIKELYDYDLVTRCCRCKNILLKTKFHKDNKKRWCTKNTHNLYQTLSQQP